MSVRFISEDLKNDIVLNDSYVSRNHLFITSERGKIRIEDLEEVHMALI